MSASSASTHHHNNISNNTNTMSSSNQSQPPLEREQTILRVKRRRNEAPCSTIRLELLGGWNVRRHDENDNSENKNILPVHPQMNGETTSGVAAATAIAAHQHIYPPPTTANMASSATTNTTAAANYLGNSQHSSDISTSTAQTNNLGRHNNRAAAVWKRVENLQGSEYYAASSSGEKRCRVVEAILEGDGRSSKRRKLTVLGERSHHNSSSAGGAAADTNKQHQGKKKHVYRVLDPVTRLVDDSLTMVHAGDRTVGEHYAFIATDPRLATQSRTWLSFKNRGGNLLHACAHWNDVELAHDLLRQSIPQLAESVDADGRTPYEIAEMCAHTSVQEVLEAFGADTTNYVYDMFIQEEYPDMEKTNFGSSNNNNDGSALKDANHTTNNDDSSTWNPLDKTSISSNTDDGARPFLHAPPPNLTAAQHAHDLAMFDASKLLELQGGVGYWTEDGELILEVDPNHMMGVTSEYDQDSDVDEDDIDSNCEDYGGNDYPDDESWEEEFLQEEQSAGDDESSGDAGPAADEYNLW